MTASPASTWDVIVIGAGPAGALAAHQLARCQLRVLLVEKDDLAQATSSASTKLFHGGLRYLEYFELFEFTFFNIEKYFVVFSLFKFISNFLANCFSNYLLRFVTLKLYCLLFYFVDLLLHYY